MKFLNIEYHGHEVTCYGSKILATKSILNRMKMASLLRYFAELGRQTKSLSSLVQRLAGKTIPTCYSNVAGPVCGWKVTPIARLRCVGIFAKKYRRGLIFLETYVNNDNINCLIKQSGIHGEIDILSIDIDSLDYYVFEAIDIISL